MEAYDSEKGFKLCSEEIGQCPRTLLAEKTDPGRKNGRKNTFLIVFRLIEGVIERILTSNFYTI